MKTRLNIILTLFTLIILIAWIAIARPYFFAKTMMDNPVESATLQADVMAISTHFSPRSNNQPETLDLLATHLHDRFAVYSTQATLQTYTIDQIDYHNVLASFGPSTTKRIVVGAHYDAFGTHPGADDNASGVAGLLELARLLSTAPLDIHVELVAFTLEEPPYFASDKMGSYVHAQSLKAANVDVKLMISMEMIGYFSDDTGSQTYPMPLLHLFYPSRGNFIAIVDQFASNKAFELKQIYNKSTNIDAYSINSPTFVTGIDFSDHRNYWHHGYPAVMVTDTAFFRNQHYHKKSDTFDRLNYTAMAEVVHGIYRYLLSATPR